MENLVEELEKQINTDCEKLALVQTEYEDFQSEAKKIIGELMEQLKGFFLQNT